MKTKFILHGGFERGAPQENDAFFREILKTAPDNAKVLLVYFSGKNIEGVAKDATGDMDQFNKNKGNKSLSFEVADKSSFSEQVTQADVIYFHGGHSGKVLENVNQYPNLKNLFEGKVVAGDSAGANVFTGAFYSEKAGALEGLGIIPAKLLSHYREENKDKISHLCPDLETIHLKEYEFKVFEI
jgi:cyanophycinase-like exopeptidase